MKLEKRDRLLLINQYKILAALEKSEASYYLELVEILERGYAIFYSMVDEWVSDDMPEEKGKFVLNLLGLYREIEDVKRSTKDERILQHNDAIFAGFDGNEEAEYLVFCRFLIERQGKFQEQKQYVDINTGMNSHMPMVQKYKRMLTARAELGDLRSYRLTVDQVLGILDA